MEMNLRNMASVAAIVVVSILFLRLGFALVDASAPIFVQIAVSLIGLLKWIIALALLLVIAILTIIMPLIIAGLLVGWLAKIAEGIKDKIKKLQESISAQTRDAAIDAAFLAFIALYAGLVFFMSTDDFLRPFLGEAHNALAIRTLAFAAAACSMSKILLLIPVRAAKVISIIVSLTILGWIVTIVYQTYSVNAGFSHLLHYMTESPRELFVLGITTCLFLVALTYPFTPRGWRRLLHVEGTKEAVIA